MNTDPLRSGFIVPGVATLPLVEALARVESSGGSNSWPRLEPGYMPAGLELCIQGRSVTGTGRHFSRAVRARWEEWAKRIGTGAPTAASWSRGQILDQTAADLGYTGDPRDLWKDEIASRWVLAYLVSLARRFGCASVRDFADGWNSGNPTDTNTVPDYTARVERAYEELTT